MKCKAAIAFLALFTTSAHGFAPSSVLNGRPSVVALEAKRGSKRQIALKTAGRIAGALGTIAFATAAVPGVAEARRAKKTVEVTKEAAFSVEKVKTVVTSASFKKIAGSVVAGLVVLLGVKSLFGKGESEAALDKIDEVFPGALEHMDLVSKVQDALSFYDYGKTTLLATSLDPDEVNRGLEEDFAEAFGSSYNMGGLAGFPFGGLTAFSSMAVQIPDGGSCLIVFGPHVGIDSEGTVGTVERRGRKNGGPCCESAIAASNYVASVSAGGEKSGPPTEALDAQQTFVGNALLPYAKRLDNSADRMVELPYALYHAQKQMMDDIVEKAANAVDGNGKIAVLGGVNINTPDGTPDFFKPLSLEVFYSSGNRAKDLTSKLE